MLKKYVTAIYFPQKLSYYLKNCIMAINIANIVLLGKVVYLNVHLYYK